MTDLVHGTLARYKKHIRDKDEPCDPCKAANNQASQEYYATHPEQVEKRRKQNLARTRAVRIWAAMHPLEIEILYIQELKKLEAADGQG